MIVDEIKLFELLKSRIGEKEAEAFVQILETKVNGKFEEAKTTLSTKEDVANLRGELKEDIANLRTELKGDIANLRAELKEDIANLRAELKQDIANTRADIIKWMFIFWVGQIGILIAILNIFFKH